MSNRWQTGSTAYYGSPLVIYKDKQGIWWNVGNRESMFISNDEAKKLKELLEKWIE